MLDDDWWVEIPIKDIVNSSELNLTNEDKQQLINFFNKLDDYVVDSQVEEEYLEDLEE